jgi:pantoate--beta-alanine ligase
LKIVRHIADLDLDHTLKIGLVPTMGAFHEGHLHLMRKARSETKTVVVSLFVNPTQFAPGEDFDRYPRDEERDAALAEANGVDVLFAPTVEDVYPRRTTSVHVGGVATRWEGAHRPGHFDGVATVVCKLFNIVSPHVAYFGLKDFQQCAVIKQMVEDLDVPVKLSFEETIRESDGLALSSRNVYLNEELRPTAPELYRQLGLVKDEIHSGTPVDQAIEVARANLTALGFQVEYMAAVDPATLEPSSDVNVGLRVIAAAKLGPVRLIDNV